MRKREKKKREHRYDRFTTNSPIERPELQDTHGTEEQVVVMNSRGDHGATVNQPHIKFFFCTPRGRHTDTQSER